MQAVLFLAICVAQAVAVTLFVRRRWPSLAPWKRVLAASTPFPAIVLLLCGYIYATAAMAPRERCGVDGCDTAMMVSTVIAVLALFGAVLAAAVAVVMNRLARK